MRPAGIVCREIVEAGGVERVLRGLRSTGSAEAPRNQPHSRFERDMLRLVRRALKVREGALIDDWQQMLLGFLGQKIVSVVDLT